jgi:hypothetical protein
VAFVTPDGSVGIPLELAAEVGQHLKRTDRLGRLKNRRRALVAHQGRIETDFQMGRVHFFDHPQNIVVISDDGRMILKGQRDPGIARVSGAFDQAVAAPSPDFLIREFLVHDGPESLGDPVGGQLRMFGDPPPGQKHPKIFGA